MTPLRAEDITLFCEDKPDGRSQRILDAAVGALIVDLPFAAAVRTVGVLSKNDVVVRAKFARAQTRPKLRVLAVRDRDFLTSALVASARGRTFDDDAQRVMAWPLPRHSVESYLLDDDVLGATVTDEPRHVLTTRIVEAAAARRWLDIVRGTLEDASFRLRRLRAPSVTTPPESRASALDVVRDRVSRMRDDSARELDPELVTGCFDALAADIDAGGPLEHRVDGRELVGDVARALGRDAATMLEELAQRARRAPPAALVADLRALLEAVPAGWRVTNA